MEESNLLVKIAELNDQDFKTIVEASILYLSDKNKLERFHVLNQSLAQVNGCKEIAKWILKNLTHAIRQNLEPSKIAKHFQANLGLDENKASRIKEMVEKHWNELKENNVEQNLMISQLVDMEWKFGVTASTNLINKLGNPFLQLKLVYNKGDQLETRFMELTLPQFYSFLHEMNKAKSQMEYLS